MEATTMRQETNFRVRREPSRTCAGCRARIWLGKSAGADSGRADREGAFRVVLGLSEGGRHDVVVDIAGRSFGRGAHVHAQPACLAKACAGGFSKAFRRQVVIDPARLGRDVSAAADRRIEGLLLGARRAGLLAFGEDAKGAAAAANTPLFVVARDAGSSVLRGPLRQAVAEGRILGWRTQEALGALFSRQLVAIVAVRHAGVAREIRRACSLSESLSVVTSL
jgi:predicted RNA-binding protein YlxR (DUF448 family)